MTAGPPSAYNGRYEIRNQVARGGTAQVYLAHDLLLDRPVALKVLDPQLSTDHAFVERFRREAQAAANLSHPNIVPVFDWGEADRTYFIVMEYVDGEPLSSIIRTQAPLNPEQAASIGADIAKALSYAHRHGVVHRDVKPGNVLITSDGQIKVTDFGIARAIGADEQVTQTGLVMGTATYFSPEQAQGLGVDGRSDIYALGVVLFEMATGRPPFTGETPVSIAYQHVREIPPTPHSLNPSIPPPLEAIILQAMAKVPEERYATAEDLRADLERFLRRQPVIAKIPGEFAGTVAPLTQETRVMSAATRVTPAVRRPERVRSTTPYWLLAGLILLAGLVTAVIFGGRQLGYFGGAKYITVPNVLGMSPTAAENKLRGDKFHYSVTNVTGTAANQNTVIHQSPTHPNTAKQGATVAITVAGNAPTKAVPSVLNQQYAAAYTTLSTAGFQVKEKTVHPQNASQVNNQVIAQSAHGKVPVGSTITLSVVQTNAVTVPSVSTDSVAQATTTLTQAQLKVASTETQQYSSSVQTGNVVGTNPPANSSVAMGSSVTLIVSQGPGDTVPNVLGQTQSQADTQIRSAGLLPCQGRNAPTKDANQAGTVQSQYVSAASNTTSTCATGPSTNVQPGGQVAPNSYVVYRLYVLTGSTTTTSTTTTTTTTFPGNTGSTTSTSPPGAT